MKSIIFTFLICLFTTMVLFASNSPWEEPRFQEIKTKFPKEKLVALSSEINIEFEITETDQLVAVQHQVDKFMSLQAYFKFSAYHTYDQYSNLEKHRLRSANKKSLKCQPICGDQPSLEIFHHDNEFCAYPMFFEKSGDIKILTTTKRYTDLKYLTHLTFLEPYPIIRRIIKIHIPEWLEAEFKESNFEKFGVQKSKSIAEDGSSLISYTITYVPSLKTEKSAKPYLFTYPNVLTMFKSYSVNEQQKTLIASTDDLYKWYRKLLSSVPTKSNKISSFTQELIKGKNQQEDKVKTIYYWVQENIRYIAFEYGLAGFRPESPSRVLENRYGDCKGMAILLKTMLLEIGVDARLGWMSTNSVPHDYNTPSLASDNHMICVIRQNGENIYLDATEGFIPLHELSERIQGQQIMIEDGADYFIDTIPLMPLEFYTKRNKASLSIEGETIKGSIEYRVWGEYRNHLGYMHQNVETPKQNDFLKYILNPENVSIKEFSSSNITNRDSLFRAEAKLEIENLVSVFGGSYYVSNKLLSNELDIKMEEDRISDIQLPFKMRNQNQIELAIPKGTKVESLPEDFSFSNPFFSCQVKYSITVDSVRIVQNFEIPEASVPIEERKAWSDFHNQLKAHYNQQIIFTKL